ncbi:hypothetical protein [Curtobacterium sp. 9128]|uniref:hypothetical protein n=1 Tax=Curtobacterium sp. 9128 TaxID=1793722 RepID=UPI002481A650|nr:hypothetical protein [Curtobacterium sp. 9128]
MQDWWAPRTSGGPSVVLSVPVADVPALFNQAVEAVPGAAAMEVRADGAVVGRRTSFALRAENIVLSFERVDATHSRVRIVREGRDGVDLGRALFFSPMARALLAAVREQSPT